MYFDFSRLFHKSSKDRTGGGRVRIPRDRSLYPDEWLTVQYKSYPRLHKLPLPETQKQNGFFQAVRTRTSGRVPDRVPFSLAEISDLCKYSAGIMSGEGEKYRRAHPSAGSRYPVELYLVVCAGGPDISPGLYHYNVLEHALDVLWKRPFTQNDFAKLFTYEWAQRASGAIFLTSVFERNQMKYGERGYRQILLETGAIMQNVYLASASLGRSCCALDGMRDTEIEKLLDIDGENESVISSLILG